MNPVASSGKRYLDTKKAGRAAGGANFKQWWEIDAMKYNAWNMLGPGDIWGSPEDDEIDPAILEARVAELMEDDKEMTEERAYELAEESIREEARSTPPEDY